MPERVERVLPVAPPDADAERARLEARIVDLEIRYTHQEELVQTLDELVRAQQDELDRLRRAIATLAAQLTPAVDDDPRRR